MELTATPKGFWAAAGLVAAAWAGASWLTSSVQKSDSANLQFALYPEFRLENDQGESITQQDFRGRYLLVFFGLTQCQDVCPTTLAKVGAVMDGLGDDADLVQPLFISLDPERDRGAGLAQYTGAFHPSIIGLSGDLVTTRAAAQSFHILYEQPGEASSLSDQSVFHSSNTLLLGPKGEWLRAFGYDMPATDIVALSGLGCQNTKPPRRAKPRFP